MNIREATASYEKWLGEGTKLVRGDLELKHERMRESSFAFLRATFYRWMQVWPERCPEAAAAPAVLAVGDLHIENFGTWRDVEGRLIWGINDFDEAYPLPYTADLVRLATSACLAVNSGDLAIHSREACDAILEGYGDGLKSVGKPFVLAEGHAWLRVLALGELRDPARFWEKMQGLPAWPGEVPAEARQVLEQQLPERELKYLLKKRVAGVGSLGRQRVVALADWRGAQVCREAKALLPSACVWAKPEAAGQRIWYGEIMEHAVRVPDPFTRLTASWVVRRLAPDCSRIELSAVPKHRDEAHLLRAMGAETANVHLGSKDALAAVQQDLKKRPGDWLHQAAKEMADAVTEDWEAWKRP
ncbi:MAG: DUF2252 domain-containing protein [Acidobacteriota bacterium]|nr:DUF2252 domain-containing protein [Acidobacteriota bacterium]